MHQDLAKGCPFAKRVVVNAEILDRFCGVYLLRRFGHGLGRLKIEARISQDWYFN
jgi:hypothetical protein